MADSRDHARHVDDWHEWSTDTTARNADGSIFEGEKPHRLFVRMGLQSFIALIEAQVTTDIPGARQLEGKSTELALTDQQAEWLIEALQQALAVRKV